MNLGIVVEGFGEVAAAPILIRRLANLLNPSIALQVLQPYRLSRYKLIKVGEIEKAVDFMARKVGPGGAVLVLIDADDDCPATLGPALVARARAARPDRHVSVVLAKREFEAWFLAGAISLRGERTLSSDLDPPNQPEQISGAKEWLSMRMTSGYSETLDQPAFAAALDLASARQSDSFDKLVRDLSALLGVSAPPRSSVG
jgi:hypothetical protein